MSEIIEYMHDLPKGWTILKFNECCDNIPLNGIKIKQKQYKNFGKFPVIDQGRELVGGYFDDEELLIPSEPPYIVFGDHTKIKKYVTFNFIAGADGVKVLKPFEFIHPKLLYYFIHAIKIPDRGYARHFQFLSNADFPIPPLNEQKRIIDKIEELITDLDKGIEYLETTQKQIKVYRQAVLQWAFEGKLTNKEFNGELPDGWESKKISQVADTFGGYAFKSGEFESQGKFQVIRMGNVRPGILRLDESPVFISKIDEKALSKAILKVNDVIVTQTGTKGKRDYGFTALISKGNLLLNQRIAAMRCNADCIPKFLLYYTWTNKFKNQFFANETGNVGQGNVGMKAVTDTIIWIPKPAEQNKVVSEIESRLSVCDKIEESLEITLQQAEALRLSIIKKSFEGKLVPQNPSDEHAEKLLERIRAAKGKVEPEKKVKVKKETKIKKTPKAKNATI